MLTKTDQKYYSQYGEDRVIEKLLAGRTGTLLDIGAWDPFTFSNSRLLIEQGWKAVLVEPSPGPLRKLLQEYGGNENITVVGAAITVEDIPVTPMWISDDGVSTRNAEFHEVWKERGGYFGRLWVPCLPLSRFFLQFGGEYDFVNVDAEGHSVEIAVNYLKGPRPLVMCVEHESKVVELLKVAQEYGYRMVHANETNVILSLI